MRESRLDARTRLATQASEGQDFDRCFKPQAAVSVLAHRGAGHSETAHTLRDVKSISIRADGSDGQPGTDRAQMVAWTSSRSSSRSPPSRYVPSKYSDRSVWS